jgi:hypothetical protein
MITNHDDINMITLTIIKLSYKKTLLNIDFYFIPKITKPR